MRLFIKNHTYLIVSALFNFALFFILIRLQTDINVLMLENQVIMAENEILQQERIKLINEIENQPPNSENARVAYYTYIVFSILFNIAILYLKK